MVDPADLEPLLLPAPVRLDRLPGRFAMPDTLLIGGVPASTSTVIGIVSTRHPCATATSDDHAHLRCGLHPDPGHDEGYTLTIVETGIDLAARSPEGFRHGAATLGQLIAQYRTSLPCLRIVDHPAFPVRGIMLDISRDRVPTMDHLRDLVDRLASWKINHLQLYTEHTFAYRGHEDVWRDASPMTPDEVRTLDGWCRVRGIDLVANQNCLGHLERWFEHPRYADLAEIAVGETWDFGGIATKTGPFSLCPSDPQCLALIDDLLDQLLPCFTSGSVNIGCDEAFDLGQGRSRDEVARRGRAPVYLDFVRQVCVIARRHGRRPMFWADIALEHPEALDGLPDDLIGLAWGYEPDAPFARWCDQLRAAGREVWVCPGTSCWRSITGRTTERRGNLLAAARDGLAHGASGYLTTAWGDLGHRQQWPITLHALAEGAHRAWSGEAAYDPRASSLHAFADRSLAIGPWLDELGDVDVALRKVAGKPKADGAPGPLRNATALFTDLHRPLGAAMIASRGQWHDVWERLEPLFGRHVACDQRTSDEAFHALECAAIAVRRALLRDPSSIDRSEAADIAARLRSLVADHRDLWSARSRPGGLERSCRHYDSVIAEWDEA